jgi:hypothetical protein
MLNARDALAVLLEVAGNEEILLHDLCNVRWLSLWAGTAAVPSSG